MPSAAIRQIQQALKDKGFDPGVIDGVWGRNSIAAVRQFQEQNGLEVDGVVGPRTSAALFSGASVAAHTASPVLPWFEEARHLMGLREAPGSENNPVIMNWANSLDIHYDGDEVPWCGLFVAHCIGLTLPQEVLPGNPLGARQWESFGEATKPRLGAVMVFWRESPASGKGHVGFYVGEDSSAYQILGGNQSDKVCLAWAPKTRFLSARWPKTAARLSSDVVHKQRDEGLSTNEA